MPFYWGRNPKATVRSVIAFAVGGAVFGVVFGLIMYWKIRDEEFKRFVVPLVAVIGAASFALVELFNPDPEPDDE